MEQRTLILPYCGTSETAWDLAKKLGGQRIKRKNSQYVYREGDFIINWGSSVIPDHVPIDKIAVNPVITVDKLAYFKKIAACPGWIGRLIPNFWEDRENIPLDCYPVVCRTTLKGSDGAGIVIAEHPGELVEAPLYVQYKKKRKEFRVYAGVMCGVPYVIDVVQKKRKIGATGDPRLLTTDSGVVFARKEIEIPDVVYDCARKIIMATGLDFAGLDIIYNEYENRAYCLEANTAPELTPTSMVFVAAFFEAFKRNLSCYQ